MPSTSSLSIRQARRIVLAAQGFVPGRGGLSRPDRRHVDKVFDKVGLIQIDSVNVLERSHFLPLFSRLGPYAKPLLESAAYCAPDKRRLFEYWGHEASLLPVAVQPLLRWRMERAERGEGVYKDIFAYARDNPAKIEEVFQRVCEHAPAGVSDLSDDERRKGPWWGWTDTKTALEWLFWTGRITTQGRRSFERIYDIPERVFPAEILNTPTPREEDAQRELLRIASRSLGVATETDLRDYFRMPVATTKLRIAELVEEGALFPVEVEGWSHQAFLAADADIPARATPRALLSPFDSLVWERSRTERLFDFRYRLEIYTPQEKRVYGYYVLPFLLGDRIAARVDLKADRKTSVLHALSAHAEPKIDRDRTASALAAELKSMATWQGMKRVELHPSGDLARDLAPHFGG